MYTIWAVMCFVQFLPCLCRMNFGVFLFEKKKNYTGKEGTGWYIKCPPAPNIFPTTIPRRKYPFLSTYTWFYQPRNAILVAYIESGKSWKKKYELSLSYFQMWTCIKVRPVHCTWISHNTRRDHRQNISI